MDVKILKTFRKAGLPLLLRESDKPPKKHIMLCVCGTGSNGVAMYASICPDITLEFEHNVVIHFVFL